MINKKGMSTWIWVLIVVILIIIGVVIYFLTSGGSDGGSTILNSGNLIPQPPAFPN